MRGFRRELEAANMLPRRLSTVETFVRDRAVVDEAVGDEVIMSRIDALRRHYADGFTDGMQAAIDLVLGRDSQYADMGADEPYPGPVPAKLRKYLEAVERDLGRRS